RFPCYRNQENTCQPRGEPPVHFAIPGTDHQLNIAAGAKTTVGKMIIESGIAGYEPETISGAIALIETLNIKEFADIGANIGIFSLVLGKTFPTMKITMFEPLPALLDMATTLAADNGVKADARSEALSNKEGTASFYISAKSDSSNS